MNDSPANPANEPDADATNAPQPPLAITISPEQDLDLNLSLSADDSLAAKIDLDVPVEQAPVDVVQPAANPGDPGASATGVPRQTPVADAPGSPKTPVAQAPAPKPATPQKPRVPSAPGTARPAPKPAQPAQAAPATPATPPTPPKPPEWKDLEPADPSDPVKHTMEEVWTGPAGWQVVAASVRGKLHAHTAKWRDDAYRFDSVDDWTIVAVSDGAGSANLSRIGARVACDEAVAKLKTFLQGVRLSPGESQPPEGDLHRLRLYLKEAAIAAKNAIRLEADRRKRVINEFHATLLVAVVTEWQGKHLIAAIQVGDGCIGLKAASGCKVLGISDHGDYSSETRFLTTPNIELEFHNRVCFSMPTGLSALALMTDGVSDDFYPEEKRIGELFDANPIEVLKTKAGEPLQGLMHGVAKDPRNGEALRDWLRYEKRASSDDRTLVLLHRSAQP